MTSSRSGREVEVPGDVGHPLVLGQHVAKDFLEIAALRIRRARAA